MLAVGEHLWGEVDTRTMKMISLLAGGVSGTRQEFCGALSAATLILGALYGRTSPTEDETLARELASGLRHQFRKAFGATRCAEVRDAQFIAEGKGNCAPIVEGTVRMLLTMLEEQS